MMGISRFFTGVDLGIFRVDIVAYMDVSFLCECRCFSATKAYFMYVDGRAVDEWTQLLRISIRKLNTEFPQVLGIQFLPDFSDLFANEEV